MAGGQPARYVARWDGSAWSAVGDGPDRAVEAMAWHTDDTGSSLYAAGAASGSINPQGSLSRWDGSRWLRLEPNPGGDIKALHSSAFDGRETLYVGGSFVQTDGLVTRRVARVVETVCPADLDGNCQLDIFDIYLFTLGFQAAQPIADFDGDGSWTFFDFSLFLGAFGQGCP